MFCMLMEKKPLRLLIIGILSITTLIVLYGFSDKISQDKTGDMYDYECLIKSCIVILISIIAIRMLFSAIINPAEIRHNKKVPGILKYIIGALVLTVAAVYIVTAIYSKSAMAIFTTLGASGIGIAFIAQDTLKELIAGIIISFQNAFRVGDWIKFPDGVIAKILYTRLTGVELGLLDDTRLYISNTKLTNSSIINLSQPTPAYFTRLDVILEHDVPIEQARRILYSATANTPGLATQEPLIVADSVLQNGILFAIFFKIPSFDVGAEMKHRVISSITHHLHEHGFKVCEIIGQINVHNITSKAIRIFNDENVTDAKTALKYSGLLKNCNDEIQSNFAERMTKLMSKAGDVICKQGEIGDTMFIIAEGVVNVSIEITGTELDGKVAKSSQVVAILSDGDYFGEMALLRGESRNATITAKSDVVLYMIDRDTIKEFTTKYPEFAKKLSEALVERNTKNDVTRNEFITQLSKRENTVTEFMNAFKSFLGS